MSITLKRPMFRKGGQVEEGIMELATPRRNYDEGKTREEIFAEAISGLTPQAQKYAQSMSQLAGLGAASNKDLLTNVLIQGGLRGMSTAGKGGTLANLAAAFEAPVGEALKKRSANKMLNIQGAMKGLELGSKVDIAERKALQKKQYESASLPAIRKELKKIYNTGSLTPEQNLEADRLSNIASAAQFAADNNPGIFFLGVAPTINGQLDEDKIALKADGTTFINPIDGLAYGKFEGEIEELDQITFKRKPKQGS